MLTNREGPGKAMSDVKDQAVNGPSARKGFRNEGELVRRADLIAATLACVAEGGPRMATVRAIAARAGVTQGLIRHYFPSKDHLMEAAYQALMDRLTVETRLIFDVSPKGARRLEAFVRAALGGEATDPAGLAAWAGFVGALNRDPRLRAIHRANYHAFREALESLIFEALSERGQTASASRLRRLGIAVNAVLDGLWLEAGLLPDAFEAGEIAEVGVEAVAALLRLETEDLSKPSLERSLP